MKVTKKIAVAMLVFAFSFLTFGGTNPSSTEDTAIQTTVEKFVNASQNKDSKELSNVLSSDFSFLDYNNITKKGVQMSKDSYIDNIKNGTIGGWAAKLNINSIDVTDNTAMAKVELVDSRVKRSGYLTLIKVDGGWEILNGVYTLQINK